MTQITINSKESKKTLPKNALQEVSTGEFFERFLASQKISPTKKHGLSDNAAVTFRNETSDILRHCNPHDAVHSPETTHQAELKITTIIKFIPMQPLMR